MYLSEYNAYYVDENVPTDDLETHLNFFVNTGMRSFEAFFVAVAQKTHPVMKISINYEII